ncbi:MAG: LysM peptidoglycan-binding domain-containing protein [Clostridiaceae bacterium]|nr:LysM peptidoglycan-binding domain-containing protein [Clostridiaceae bacterium]
MSSVVRVNACVYSRIGFNREKNTCSFYMNGKFTSENYIDNVQASMESRGTEYLFAIADNMECEIPDQNMHVSMLKEIGRAHEKATVNETEISSDIKDLESRINETERLLSSFLEINQVPVADSRWNLGFAGLRIKDGQFAALTGGNGHVFMMRDGMFRPLANETAKARRAIDAQADDEEIQDGLEIPGEEAEGSVIVSDIYSLQQDDAFVLVSQGVMEALGEEKIEDLMASRSDSSYIAHRITEEAMKRSFTGDLAVMVIQIERVYGSSGTAKRSRNIQKQQRQTQSVKKKVERLNKVPPVTYKYSRNSRKISKHQSTISFLLTVITVVVAFVILFKFIDSLKDAGINNILDNTEPTQTATATPTVSPSETPSYEETPLPEDEEPVDIEDPEDSEPATGEIIEHVVKSGESINSIVKKYYNDLSLIDKLCEYNNIENPNLIKIDQVIKIPPKEVLMQQ